jgi:phosphotriesterase-related protein
MKNENLLSRVLVSHDAGWYEPGKPGGGEYRGYSILFKKLIPELKAKQVNDQEIKQLTQTNPMNAFSIQVRRLK